LSRAVVGGGMHIQRTIAGTFTTLVVFVSPAFAEPAIPKLQESYHFNIPAQTLDTALLAFSEQAQVQILLWGDAKSTIRSPGAQGELRAQDALVALLQDSGLTYQVIDDATIAIRAADGAALSSQTNSDNARNVRGESGRGGRIRLAQAGNQSAGGNSRSNAEGNSPISEIIVTAQRRESLESKTPLAMTAISGPVLRSAGVTNPLALTDQVPNLAINRARGMQITIRGVTSTDGTEKGDPSAAFLLDGVYIARAQAQEVSFFDINRIEVLRGPQGTLYGRNTTAGVINVITNRPIHEYEATLNGSFGDFGSRQADGMINIPVNERFALRAAASYDRRDNYLEQGVPSPFDEQNPFTDNVTGRLQGLLDFNEHLSLLLRADYSKTQGNSTEFGANTVRASTVFDVSDPRNPVYIGNHHDLLTRNYANTGRAAVDNDTWGISAELNWNLGPAALTYLGSYRELKRDENTVDNNNGVSTRGRFEGDYWQSSQEVRIASTWEGRWSAQAGLYYFKERSGILYDIIDLLPDNTIFAFPQEPTISESYAPFGQVTFAVLPELRLTAGVRYSHDDKSRVGATVRRSTEPRLDGFVFNPVTDRLNSAAIQSSKVTWRAGIDYDFNDHTLFYGSVATGYKAGGFNDGCEPGSTTNGISCNQPRPLDVLYYNPETLTAYEGGFKARLAENHVRLNGSVFYYDYQNLQLSTTANCAQPGGPQEPCQVTRNAAKAKVKGIELESTLAPAPRHRLDLTATYLDGAYLQYVPIAAGPDYAGRPLDRSPEFTLGAAYTYSYPLVNESSLDAALRSRFSDSYVLTNTALPAQYRQPSFSMTDISITYTAAADRWYVQGYARNLEDKIILTYVDGNGNVIPGDPRTIGVRAGMRF
jgi:iron complex outermembrane recepter protein